MSTIGNAPANFSLSTYNTTRVSGVNDGGSVSLSTYLGSGKRIVLFFVNIASAERAYEWLEILRSVEDANTQPIAVCFNHDGTGYLGTLGVSVANVTSVIEYNCSTDPERDAAHGNFAAIPVLRDPNGTISEGLLDGIVDDAGLYGRPAGSTKLFSDLPAGFAYGMWAYIIGPDDAVRDKWHNEWVSDPLSLVHLLDAGAGEVFPVGDVAGWTTGQKALLSTLIATRCGNLGSSLEILSASPGTASYLSSPPASIEITFSRPLNAALAGTPATWVLGGGAVAGGAGNAAAADYTGIHFIENTVSLTFAGVILDDSGGWDMTLSFPNLRDSASGAPAAGHDSLDWDVSTSVPSVTAAARYGVDGSDVRHASVASGGSHVVGFGDVEVDLAFNEPLPDQASNPVAVTDSLGTNAAQNVTFAVNAADRTRAALSFNAQHANQDGEWTISVAADALTDGAGVTGPAAAWNGGTVALDAAPPKPSVSIEGVVSGGTVGRHRVRVTVDFGEAVSGWDTADITGNFTVVGGGSLAYVAAGASPGSYIYDWQLSGAGAKSLTVQAAAAQDIPLGRNTPVSDAFAFTYAPVYKDLVVVVDKSGSMGWDIPFDSGSGPVDTPKWTIMEPRIEEFLAELKACVAAGTVHGTEDQLAFITYDSAVHSVPIAGSSWEAAGDVGDSATPGPFEAALRAVSPGGSTAMASAIGEAYALLDACPAGRDKAVILFADGQRNAGASLTVDGVSGVFEIGAPYNRAVSQGAPGNYPVYAAGIHTELASASQWLVDLETMTVISGGLYMDVTDADPFDDATTAFAAFFDHIFGGHTPVTVTRVSGTIPAGREYAEVEFRLDRRVSGLVAAAAWPGSAGLGLRLYREGVPVSSPDASVAGLRHLVQTLVFPHVQNSIRPLESASLTADFRAAGSRAGASAFRRPGFAEYPIHPLPLKRVEMDAEGAWKVRVYRQGSANVPLPFVVRIVAEQDGPEPRVTLPKPPYLTGKTCAVRIRLPGGGIRIDRARLTLVNCALSYANLAAAHAAGVPGIKPVEFQPAARVRGRKLPVSVNEEKNWALVNQQMKALERALASKPEVSKALSSRDVRVLEGSVKVSPTGADCRWSLPVFAHPGHYRLEFVIEGSSKASGPFRRQVSRSLAVLPDVDLGKSVLEYREDPRTGAFNARVAPQDKAGNLLGPGHADIFAALPHKPGSLKVTDRMNGTYEVSGIRQGGLPKKGEQAVPKPPRFFRGPGFFGGRG